jgi:ribosomal protein S18 acetylase RimI-like enzyme
VTVAIATGDARDLASLREAFLALHDHQLAISDVPVIADPDRAWAERLATYRRAFADGDPILLIAKDGERVIGYALALEHAGTDDTFALAPRYGELYTLTVVADRRGEGVGTVLCDAVDQALAERGVDKLVIATMARNADAVRFYERRGLVPGELLLYRLPRA